MFLLFQLAYSLNILVDVFSLTPQCAWDKYVSISILLEFKLLQQRAIRTFHMVEGRPIDSSTGPQWAICGLVTMLQLRSLALSAVPLDVIWLQKLTSTILMYKPS